MWDKKRKEELEVLFELIRTISEINYGSGFINKISNCIILANSLDYWDINGKGKSLVNFLIEEANKEDGEDK